MKRTWHFNYFLTSPKIEFSFVFGFPCEDDYFKNQYQLYICMFGSVLTIGTWRE